MTDVELAWLAGILEGEGSFIVAYSKIGGRRYSYARITVNMTDLDVIERVHTLTKTRCAIFTQPIRGTARKQQYRVWVNGAAAVTLMTKLRPLMGERRRAQIDKAIAAHVESAATPERKREQVLDASSKRWKGVPIEERRAAMQKTLNARWHHLDKAAP